MPNPQTDCNKELLVTINNIKVWTYRQACFYQAGMAIDADGAPNAYHPDDIGLDYLANAGRPGNWWGIVTDANGNPVVQGPHDPFTGYYISTTALVDTTKKMTDPHRYVDSRVIPFNVLPPELYHKSGAKRGDLAVALNTKNGKLSNAILADVGPRKKLGEGSIALAENLGIPSDPKRGGTGGKKYVIYVVFPGSGNGKPRPVQEIEAEGAKHFQKWGGMARIKACFP